MVASNTVDKDFQVDRQLVKEGDPGSIHGGALRRPDDDAGGTDGVDLYIDSDREKLLSEAYVRDTVGVLPLKPNNITSVGRPEIQVSFVDDDPAALDVDIHHRFRAHFDIKKPADASVRIEELEGSGDLRELDEQMIPMLDAVADLKLHASSIPNANARGDENIEENGIIKSRTRDVEKELRYGGNVLVQHGISGPAQWYIDPKEVMLGQRIAVGGFAEVFVGKYKGTLVAVKVLMSDCTDVFVKEVATLASLRHPNLILFMGYSTAPRPSIVSEYMHRGSLYDMLRSEGKPLAREMFMMVALSVARGMAYLHSRTPHPILHLDLKSPNILIDAQWRIKIADFGLSKTMYKTIMSGTTGGTPEYMAPEVLRAEPPTKAADVYSFGVILWECLTGERPWQEYHAMQVVGIVAYRGESLPVPSTCSDPFAIDLCTACLNHEPDKRPSFDQIVEQIESRYLSSQPKMIKTLSQQHFEVAESHNQTQSSKSSCAPMFMISDKAHSPPDSSSTKKPNDSVSFMSPFAN